MSLSKICISVLDNTKQIDEQNINEQIRDNMKSILNNNKYKRPKFIPRNNLSKHDWIKLYFTQTEFFSKMYYSGKFTDYDLLYFLPNNKLKRLGFPMKRGGKNKIIKKYRLHNLEFCNIVEEIIEERLCNQFQKEFFNKFVSINDLDLGDKNIYKGEDLWRN